MSPARLWLVWGLTAGTIFLVAILVARSLAPSPPKDLEVAVLFPSTDLSAWPDFLRAIRLAAEEKNLAVEESSDRRSSSVLTQPVPIRFQWYPVIGSFGMQRQVRELCLRDRPPLAIVGASNTALTAAIGEEIRATSRPQWTPLLLMTYASADGLIDVNPGRSFRFGFPNSYQAKSVVRRVQELISASESTKSSPPRAIVVQALDSPFSLDLSTQFADLLHRELAADLLPAPDSFQSSSHGDKALWSLKTATASHGSPTTQESDLARAVVAELSHHPDRPFIFALTVGGEPFANILEEIHREMVSQSLSPKLESGMDRIIIVTGDGIDYYDFADPSTPLIPPASLPGPVVFFSHVNPIDPSITAEPNEHQPSIGLNREVVRSLLATLPNVGADPSPDRLVKELSMLEKSGEPIFSKCERTSGGGALVVATTSPDNQFSFSLPEQWRGPLSEK